MPNRLDPRDDSPQARRDRVVDLSGRDTIDLHTFRPKDVPSVIQEFLDAAVEAGLTRVRIVHGKGIGVQRRIVRELLAHHPQVVSFTDAPDSSGWGATVAHLRRRTGPAPPARGDGRF